MFNASGKSPLKSSGSTNVKSVILNNFFGNVLTVNHHLD